MVLTWESIRPNYQHNRLAPAELLEICLQQDIPSLALLPREHRKKNERLSRQMFERISPRWIESFGVNGLMENP